MATVLPGSPPAYNRNDISATVKALCNYTRTLQENADYILGQLKKASEQNTTDIATLKTSVESLRTQVSGLQSSVESLGNNYNSLSARVTALEQAIG